MTVRATDIQLSQYFEFINQQKGTVFNIIFPFGGRRETISLYIKYYLTPPPYSHDVEEYEMKIPESNYTVTPITTDENVTGRVVVNWTGLPQYVNSLTIRRETPILQNTTFYSQSRYGEDAERAMDNLTMICQDLSYECSYMSKYIKGNAVKIETIDLDLQGIHNKLVVVENEISLLKSEDIELLGIIEALREQVLNIKREIEQSIEALSREVSHIETDMGELETDMGELSEKLTEISYKVDELESDVIVLKRLTQLASKEEPGIVQIGEGIEVNEEGVISVDIPSAEIATTESLGVVQIGEGLSITEGGVLSAEVADLPIATDSSVGVVQIGEGIDIDENGVISADIEFPTASSESAGIVQIGEGIDVTEGGVISVDIPVAEIATTESLGVVQIGEGLSITEGGVLSAQSVPPEPEVSQERYGEVDLGREIRFNRLNQVIFVENTGFYAVGNDGTVLYSLDGIKWVSAIGRDIPLDWVHKRVYLDNIGNISVIDGTVVVAKSLRNDLDKGLHIPEEKLIISQKNADNAYYLDIPTLKTAVGEKYEEDKDFFYIFGDSGGGGNPSKIYYWEVDRYNPQMVSSINDELIDGITIPETSEIDGYENDKRTMVFAMHRIGSGNGGRLKWKTSNHDSEEGWEVVMIGVMGEAVSPFMIKYIPPYEQALDEYYDLGYVMVFFNKMHVKYLRIKRSKSDSGVYELEDATIEYPKFVTTKMNQGKNINDILVDYDGENKKIRLVIVGGGGMLVKQEWQDMNAEDFSIRKLIHGRKSKKCVDVTNLALRSICKGKDLIAASKGIDRDVYVAVGDKGIIVRSEDPELKEWDDVREIKCVAKRVTSIQEEEDTTLVVGIDKSKKTMEGMVVPFGTIVYDEIRNKYVSIYGKWIRTSTDLKTWEITEMPKTFSNIYSFNDRNRPIILHPKIVPFQKGYFVYFDAGDYIDPKDEAQLSGANFWPKPFVINDTFTEYTYPIDVIPGEDNNPLIVSLVSITKNGISSNGGFVDKNYLVGGAIVSVGVASAGETANYVIMSEDGITWTASKQIGSTTISGGITRKIFFVKQQGVRNFPTQSYNARQPKLYCTVNRAIYEIQIQNDGSLSMIRIVGQIPNNLFVTSANIVRSRLKKSGMLDTLVYGCIDGNNGLALFATIGYSNNKTISIVPNGYGYFQYGNGTCFVKQIASDGSNIYLLINSEAIPEEESSKMPYIFRASFKMDNTNGTISKIILTGIRTGQSKINKGDKLPVSDIRLVDGASEILAYTNFNIMLKKERKSVKLYRK